MIRRYGSLVHRARRQLPSTHTKHHAPPCFKHRSGRLSPTETCVSERHTTTNAPKTKQTNKKKQKRSKPHGAQHFALRACVCGCVSRQKGNRSKQEEEKKLIIPSHNHHHPPHLASKVLMLIRYQTIIHTYTHPYTSGLISVACVAVLPTIRAHDGIQ